MKKNQFFLRKDSLIISLLLFFFGAVFSFAQTDECMNRTYTIGGWGAPNQTTPQTSYLYANFNSAFPNGLVIGCPAGKTLKLSSANAVTNFLPSGGTPAPLNENLVDPQGEDYKNTLASQLIGVTLAVTFDAFDSNYSSSNIKLGDYFILESSSPFYLKTVNELLAMANNFIGNCGNSPYSASQFTDALDAVNNSYHEGKSSSGYLSCCKLKIKYTQEPIKCFGGKAKVTISYENGSSATTGAGVFYVEAGTHTFTVQDGDCKDSVTLEISQPTLLNLNITSTEIKCYGENTTITANVSGGTGGYTYLWSNGATTKEISVPAGTYSVTVMDGNDCTKTAEITVSQPEPLGLTLTSTEIKCFGEKSTITANVSGGTAPYTYLWSNGATTQSIEVVAGQSYSVTVTDSKGCIIKKESEVISQPAKLEAEISKTEIKCYGGDAVVTVNVTGGTAPYNYLWSNGETTNTITVKAGTYSVKVTDSKGCFVDINVQVTEPKKLLVDLNSTLILCNGGSTTVTANVSGGTGSYRYEWKKDGVTLSETGNSVTGTAGAYSVTVWDANECVASDSENVYQPEIISVKASAKEVTCVGGKADATVTVTGGTAPYQIHWIKGDAVLASGASVQLAAGDYTVSVTDANGCKASANITVKQQTCDGFTTVTQGGWGAKAAGNNWGTYRDKNFAGAFPNGVTVGSGSRFLKFTSAKAVENFLPSGGTPRSLNAGTMTDPTEKSYGNTLAGQVVALTLSVGFDAFDMNFSTSETPLGSLIVVSGIFNGMTVKQILTEANKVLGGESSSYTAQQINEIVSAINENYDNGKVNKGVLACPCTSTPTETLKIAEAAKPTSAESKMQLYPNPSKGDINLKFEAESGSAISVQLYDISGKMVADLSKSASRSGNQVSVAYSNYNLTDGLYIVRVKTSKEEKTFKLIVRK